MKKLSDYLDLAKELTGSDYKTAQAMGVTRAAISNSRKSGSMDIDNCVKLAKILDIHPEGIIAACDVARNPENEKFWLKWVAAAIIVSGPIMMNLSYESMAYGDFLNGQVIHYTLLTVFIVLAIRPIVCRPLPHLRMT